MAGALFSLPARAASQLAPLTPYPVAVPGPVGNSHLPPFLDDDELIRARITPSGAVSALIDDVILKLRGSGDFVVQLPEPVRTVTDNGGDSPPGLQDGRITFLGHLDGTRLLASEANLDPARYRDRLPLTTAISYTADGSVMDPGPALGRSRAVVEHLLVNNLTEREATVVRGTPAGAAGRDALARTLENLRMLPALFTPELDLQSLFPMPAGIPIDAGARLESVSTFAPFRLLVTVRLPAGAILDGAPGAAVSSDKAGTRLTWTLFLPDFPGGRPTVDIQWAFREQHFAIPSVDVLAVALPYPATLYIPPGGGAWASYLAKGDTAAALRLAQVGTAALGRIGDVTPLIGRPGPGPVRVQYDFFLPSQRLSPRSPPPPPASGPQPLAVALATAGALLIAANLWWAWSRH